MKNTKQVTEFRDSTMSGVDINFPGRETKNVKRKAKMGLGEGRSLKFTTFGSQNMR